MSDQVSLKEFRNSIRQQILKTRRAISEDEAFKAGLKVTETLKDEAFFKQEQRLVNYQLNLSMIILWSSIT